MGLKGSCQWIVQQGWFESTVLLMILVNLVVMMIDDPRDDPNSDKHQMIIKNITPQNNTAS